MRSEITTWNLFDELDKMFQAPMRNNRPKLWQPAAEFRETNEAYYLSFDLAGFKREDIHLELDGETLKVSGEREQTRNEEEDLKFVTERTYGSFERTFQLPEDVDGESIEAKHKDGVLSLSLPKSLGKGSRRIDIL